MSGSTARRLRVGSSRRSAARTVACSVVALISAAVLAACGRPAGVDGDLTNGWGAMPAARAAVPVAGVCYADRVDGSWYVDSFTTVPCDGRHQAETVSVGSYSTGGSTPPAAASPAQVDAYTRCRAQAASYLGDDYRDGLLELTLIQPSAAAWAGGARWYRCDIVRYADAGFTRIDDRPGSVRGGLSGSRPLALTCKTLSWGSTGVITQNELTDCAKPHNAEFAGVYAAPAAAWSDDDQKRDDLASNGCEAVVAAFLGFPGREFTSSYLGWEYERFDKGRWLLGDRTTQCFVLGFKGAAPNGARFVGSVKGIGGGRPKSWS